MPVQHVKPSALTKKYPNAGCTDCMKQAEGAPEDQLWTIWMPMMYYCPKCASNQGIGPQNY